MTQNVITLVDQNNFGLNAFIITSAKFLMISSVAIQCLVIFSNEILGFRQFLMAKVFQIMCKTMAISFILAPIIAKSYQASLTSAFV